MDFVIIFIGTIFLLTSIFDMENPIPFALFIAFMISGSGDSDSEEEIDTVKGKPTIVTEEKIITASQKNIVKELPEDETRVEWQDDSTKWSYHKGQTWETQKNF